MANFNEIIQEINTNLPDNNAQSITAKKLRDTLVDTVYNTAEGYDISVNNSGTKYADLTTALGTNGGNVPTDIRKGGMVIRFVNYTTNKYEQYRYLISSITDSDFVNIDNWQGIDDEPIPGSDNLITSGGVFSMFATTEDCEITQTSNRRLINAATGELTTAGSASQVRAFSINDNTEYLATGTQPTANIHCSIGYYDEDENYLGYERAGNDIGAEAYYDYKLTIPQGAKIVKIYGNTGETLSSLKKISYDIDKALLKEKQELTDQEINDVLENLKLKNNSIIISNIDRTTNKVILLSDGSLSDYHGSAFIVDKFEIPNSDDVVYLASGRITNNAAYCSIAYYDENENYLGYELQGGTAQSFADYRLTIPRGTKYIKIWGNSGFGDLPVLEIFTEGKLDEIDGRLDTIEQGLGYSIKDKNIAIIGDSISTHGNTGTNPNAVEITITTEDVGQTLSAYVTASDVSAGLTLGGTTYTISDIGNEVTFVPTSEDVGKVIGIPLNYNLNSLNVWWTYVRDFFECNIIPVCWSGSGLTRNRTNSNSYKASYAWHESQIRKCGIRTPGTMDRTAPDVIIITRGVNDFTHAPYALLTDGYFDNYDVQYPENDIIQDDKYGFKEAYFLTIGKLREAYPFAKIVLCTYPVVKRVNTSHFPMNNGYYSQPQYNNAVREIANFCGCDVIEFDKCGITWENMYPTYISDSATNPTHPNAKGHEVMGKCAIDALKNINFDLQ